MEPLAARYAGAGARREQIARTSAEIDRHGEHVAVDRAHGRHLERQVAVPRSRDVGRDLQASGGELDLATAGLQHHAVGAGRGRIARRIEQISRGAFKVNPGSLLTALARLERAGGLDSEWRQTVNSRRAKYYTVTRGGKRQLEAETADWAHRAAAVARILKSEG